MLISICYQNVINLLTKCLYCIRSR